MLIEQYSTWTSIDSFVSTQKITMTLNRTSLSLKDFHLHEDHLRRTIITSFLMTNLDHFVPSSMGFPLISTYLIAPRCRICHFPHLCHRLFLPSPKAPATALRCLPSSGMVETWRSLIFTSNKARFANEIVPKDIEGMYIFIRPVLSLHTWHKDSKWSKN